MLSLPDPRDLHPRLERLVGEAVCDPDLLARLLKAPAQTTAEMGLPAEDQALVADIQATDLRTFGRALFVRLYGYELPEAPRFRQAVAR